MPIRSINNTFNRGELDPTLYSRIDIDVYNKGARKLRNMLALWTGAARIAPGTNYTDVIVDRENSNAVISNADNVKGLDFLYDADGEIIYTIIIRTSGSGAAFDIYFNNTLQTTVLDVAPTYTTAQIKNIHFAIGHDRVLFLHESVKIKELVRGGSHTSWTLAALTPNIFPTFDYSTLGKATNYRSFTFTLGATSGSGVSLSSSSNVFTANHVGGLLIGNGGKARITAVASQTSATVRVLNTFDGTTVRGQTAFLGEKMWTSGGGSPSGADRGWPSRGAFFLNRLILGRNKAIRNAVAVSTAGVFDDFDDSDTDDFASFNTLFNGKGEQSIQSIIPDDSVIFLTTNKAFAQSPLVESPISISNVYFAPQTQAPASTIEASVIDNQILFTDETKSQVMRLVYNTDTAKYLAVPAGLLSGHLFETVQSNATWDPQNQSTRLYMASQSDGSILIYSTLASQDVSAWSLRTTRGSFKQVIGDGRQTHVIVERQINLGTSTFETSMDFAYLSDSTFKAFNDVQSEFDSSSGSAVGVLENDDNFVVLGNEIPFTAIDLTFNTASSDDCGLEFEYLDSNGFWNSFSPTDNTTGFATNGSITWAFSDVLNWEPNEVNEVASQYWIRIKRTTDSVTTTPIIEQLQVNTGVRLFLEKKNFDTFTDSTVSATSDSSGNITGLTNLKGQQVYAVENNATSGPYFVDENGDVTIDNLNADVEIGIQYIPKLVPMPVLAPTNEGDNAYTQKYVQDLFIDYVESLYLQAGVDTKLSDVPNMKLGSYTLGQDVVPQTGVFKFNPRPGWDPRQEFIITQSQPGPMTIIGVGYHVEVS